MSSSNFFIIFLNGFPHFAAAAVAALSCFGSFHYSCMWHVAVVVAAVGGCCTIWVLLVAVGWLTADRSNE